jgi:hypothetical protein
MSYMDYLPIPTEMRQFDNTFWGLPLDHINIEEEDAVQLGYGVKPRRVPSGLSMAEVSRQALPSICIQALNQSSAKPHTKCPSCPS